MDSLTLASAKNMAVPPSMRSGRRRPRTTSSTRQEPGNVDRLRITIEVAPEHAPALKSAVDEISAIIGTRLESPHSFFREQALTSAAICVAGLRAAVNAQVRAGDPHYAR